MLQRQKPYVVELNQNLYLDTGWEWLKGLTHSIQVRAKYYLIQSALISLTRAGTMLQTHNSQPTHNNNNNNIAWCELLLFNGHQNEIQGCLARVYCISIYQRSGRHNAQYFDHLFQHKLSLLFNMNSGNAGLDWTGLDWENSCFLQHSCFCHVHSNNVSLKLDHEPVTKLSLSFSTQETWRVAMEHLIDFLMISWSVNI